MALPLVPVVLASGLTGVTGFIAGGSLSDKLGSAFTVTGFVVGLFLVLVLIQRLGVFS